jgi:hypothetical protein
VLEHLLSNERFMEVTTLHDNSSTVVKEHRHKYLTLEVYSRLKPDIDVLLSMDFEL